MTTPNNPNGGDHVDQQGAGHESEHHNEGVAPKKRSFKKWYFAAALVLAAALAWWLWPASEEAPTPAPVVTKVPTPVPKPTTPPVVATPTPAPTPAPAAPLPTVSTPSTADEATMPVTYETLDGVKNRCVTTLLNGAVVQKDCFPIE